MRTRQLLALSLSLVIAATAAAGAQDPVRLPGMVVKAAPPPPGPKLFAGIVRDTDATPLEGVEIIIPELGKRVLSNADGMFRFTDMPSGDWEMRARKLGYAQQVRDFKVEKQGGSGEFELVPWPRVMPPVVTSAARGGLSGRVADTSFAPVAGARVSVTTKALRAETDSNGAFFLPAPPGSWMVIIRKPGYADRIASVTIPSDSGRHLSTMLMPATSLPVRERHNVDDLESRQIWRDKMKQPFYTHEDIEKLGITWIYDLIRMSGGDQYSTDCAVVINGGPATRLLNTLTVDEVESVEVYGANRFERPRSMASPRGRGRNPLPPAVTRASDAVAARVPITNTEAAAFQNQGVSKYCPGAVYVWLR
jgi:hypothetical protein